MATVYLSSPTNSTMFTTCCEVAVGDNQSSCPNCGQSVEPNGGSARWSYAYRQRGYGNTYPNHGEGRFRGKGSFEAAARAHGRIK